MCALFLGPTKPTTWCNLCCWDIAEPGFCFETNLPPCSATAENVLFACFTELLFKSSFFQKISLMGYDDGSWCKVKKITLAHSWRLHFWTFFLRLFWINIIWLSRYFKCTVHTISKDTEDLPEFFQMVKFMKQVGIFGIYWIWIHRQSFNRK